METAVDVDWTGHAWTVGPKLRFLVHPPDPPPTRPWRRVVDRWGTIPVPVTGRYRRHPGADRLVVIVHGLGGCDESDYCAAAAEAVERRGWSSLRLSLRGATRGGEDLYHGGLVADLRAALTAPAFDRYRDTFVLGYSLGGHLALRAAVDLDLPSFRAAAAICAPTDLEAAQRNIDAPGRRVYREYLLRELRAIYRAVWDCHGGPTPLDRVQRIRRLREWDALTVVPRFGFEDVSDYYRRASVAGELDRLRRPSLLVGARHDPFVPPRAIEPGLPDTSDRLTVRWSDRGGHVYFPGDLDLGFDGPPGLVPQVLSYLEGHATS